MDSTTVGTDAGEGGGNTDEHLNDVAFLLEQTKEDLKRWLRADLQKQETMLKLIVDTLRIAGGVTSHMSHSDFVSRDVHSTLPLPEESELGSSYLERQSSMGSDVLPPPSPGAKRPKRKGSDLSKEEQRATLSLRTTDVAQIMEGADAALKAMAPTTVIGQTNRPIRETDDSSMTAFSPTSLRWKRARSCTRTGSFQSVSEFFNGGVTWQGALKRKLLDGGVFRFVCVLVIIFDAVLISIQTDHYVKHGDDTHLAQVTKYIGYSIVGWYVVELGLRIVGEKPFINFIKGKDWRWNIFDSTLTMLSVVDVLLIGISLRQLAVVRIVRVLRLLRVMRVLRIFRFLTFLREFHKLVLCLASSAQTLMCAMSLMSFFIFCVAIMFTQSIGRYLEDNAAELDPELHAELDRGFGSVGDSMLSMYMAITAGRNWGELYRLLEQVETSLSIFFVVFLVIAIYGLTNVVTAVFVESAMQATQHYRDLLVQEMLLKERANVKHMKEIFYSIDTDNSGAITLAEMNSFLQDETLQLQEYFEALDLSASDTETLFQLLDLDGSGEVDIDEFCDGCMRLGGPAKSFDINCMWYEQRRINREILKFIQHACTGLHSLAKSQAEANEMARIATDAQKILDMRGKKRLSKSSNPGRVPTKSALKDAVASQPSARVDLTNGKSAVLVIDPAQEALAELQRPPPRQEDVMEDAPSVRATIGMVSMPRHDLPQRRHL